MPMSERLGAKPKKVTKAKQTIDLILDDIDQLARELGLAFVGLRAILRSF